MFFTFVKFVDDVVDFPIFVWYNVIGFEKSLNEFNYFVDYFLLYPKNDKEWVCPRKY